jgi:hypothetical protein
MGWWRNYGSNKFPHIYIAACIALGKPYTNAHLERSFSIGTWFDGTLRQNQLDLTLEMRIVEKLNRKMIRTIYHEYFDAIKKGKEKEEETLNKKKENAEAVINNYRQRVLQASAAIEHYTSDLEEPDNENVQLAYEEPLETDGNEDDLCSVDDIFSFLTGGAKVNTRDDESPLTEQLTNVDQNNMDANANKGGMENK